MSHFPKKTYLERMYMPLLPWWKLEKDAQTSALHKGYFPTKRKKEQAGFLLLL